MSSSSSPSPTDDQLLEYLLKEHSPKIEAIVSQIHKLEKLDVALEEIIVGIAIYVCPARGGVSLVKIGTKGNPSGVSTSKHKFFAFADIGPGKKEEVDIYPMSALKAYLREKWSSLERRMDERYEAMCAVVDVEDFKAFHSNRP